MWQTAQIQVPASSTGPDIYCIGAARIPALVDVAHYTASSHKITSFCQNVVNSPDCRPEIKQSHHEATEPTSQENKRWSNQLTNVQLKMAVKPVSVCVHICMLISLFRLKTCMKIFMS